MSNNAKKAPPRPAEGSPRSVVADRPMTKLDHTLALADYGFKIFPLIPNDKRPLVDGWQALATNDKATVRRMWAAHPNANIGISTERLLVIDVDPRNGGDKTFQALFDAQHLIGEDFTPTLAAGTQSNGTHMFYHLPDGITVRGGANKLGAGVDVKSHGGYVVGAGSTIDGRPYYWKAGYEPNKRDFAEAPGWLIQRCNTVTPKSAAAGTRIAQEDEHTLRLCRDYIERRAPRASVGERGYTAFKVACEFYNYAATKETCEEMLTDWSETHCEAPMDREDIAHAAYSALKNCEGAIGCKHPFATGFTAHEIKERVAPTTLVRPINFEDPSDVFTTDAETPPLDVSATFGPHLATWINDEAERKGVDPAMVAGSLLAGAAGAISQRINIQVKQHDKGHTTKPVFWFGIVAEPSARKSPVTGVIARLFAVNEKPWTERYAQERRSYDLALAAWKAASREGSSSPEPTPPVRRRKIIHNATTESLSLLLQEQKSGLFQLSDELSGWLGSHDAYRQNNKKGSVDTAFWLGAKDGASHITDRVGRESVFVESVAISILGGIQPSVIGPMIGDLSGNGMLPRFNLFVAGKAKQGQDRAPHPIGEVVERAFGVLMNMEFPAEAPTLTFTSEADMARKDLLAFVDAKIDNPDLPLGVSAWLGKSENEGARIAAVLHVLDFAIAEALGQNTQADDLVGDTISQDPFDAGIRRDGVFGEQVVDRLPLQISETTARRAYRFLVDFQFPQQIKFYREVAGANAEAESYVRRIASYILRNDLTQITERRVQQSIAGLKGGTVEQIRKRQQALQILVMNGWLEPESTHSVKGHPNKFTVNPAVHDGRFAHIKAEETARCEKAQAEIAREADTRRIQRQAA